jgi:hypothetical protein
MGTSANPSDRLPHHTIKLSVFNFSQLSGIKHQHSHRGLHHSKSAKSLFNIYLSVFRYLSEKYVHSQDHTWLRPLSYRLCWIPELQIERYATNSSHPRSTPSCPHLLWRRSTGRVYVPKTARSRPRPYWPTLSTGASRLGHPRDHRTNNNGACGHSPWCSVGRPGAPVGREVPCTLSPIHAILIQPMRHSPRGRHGLVIETC